MERKGSVLMHRYELGRFLGQGTFAKVYHARNLKTGTSVAIKIIDKERVLKAGMTEQIKREISIMRLVKHPNIVHLYEVMATKTKIYFVMEYIKGGELFNKVVKGKLREDVTRKYFQQLVSAVDYCHSHGVCHRDLKPENLLLDEEGNLKVTDFGLSSLAESRHQDGLLHTTCGTPAYVAPEVISRKGYDGFKADVWSCGVILYVLLAGYLPFSDPNLMEMYRKIARGEFKFPNWFGGDVRRLLKRMLDPNPKTRISMEKIKRSSWFRKGEEREKVVGGVDGKVKTGGIVEEEGCCEKLNAFEIISMMSSGLDLSGMFGEEAKEEMRFTCKRKAWEIVRKLEEIGTEEVRMEWEIGKEEVKKKKKKKIVMERRKGELKMEGKVYEITPNFHVVEFKRMEGDTLEFHRFVNDTLKPHLNDFVFAWL